jgi:hypothetical protein
VARRVGPDARGASRAPTGPLGRQLTDTLVDHRSLAPSPPWAGRDGEGRSGSKGGEGPARGRQSMSSAQAGFFFQPTTPALAAATISKMPLKPLLLLPHTRANVRMSPRCCRTATFCCGTRSRHTTGRPALATLNGCHETASTHRLRSANLQL